MSFLCFLFFILLHRSQVEAFIREGKVEQVMTDAEC
jgi:hypothetical protein